MQVSRRHFAAAAVGSAAALGLRFPANAAEFNYRMSLQVPAQFPTTAHVNQMVDRIQKDTSGRLEIKVFPNSQLGTEPQILNQLRLGAIEMTLGPDGNTAQIVQAAGITWLPFLVTSLKELLSIQTGGFNSFLHAALMRSGIYQFQGTWDSGGFRHVGNSIRPVRTPADMAGLKIRSTEVADEVAAIKAMGAAAVPIAQVEAYTGLQTHLADGTVAGPVAYEAFKFNEVTKYYSLINYGCGPWTMLASPTAFDKLPKNIQDIVSRNMELARNENNTEMTKLPILALERMKAKGLIVNEGDIPSFQKAIKDSGLYAQWKARYGPSTWALLERSIGRTIG